MKGLKQLLTRSTRGRSHHPEPAHGNVFLRLPQLEDFEQWTALRKQSREFLEPWEPLWTDHEFTWGSFRERIRQVELSATNDTGYYFLIFQRTNEQLLGGINLSNVRRGVAQMGSIGYWVGAPHAHQGVMTQALRAMVDFAFLELVLHRLEAACIPTNSPSVALLRRCGFEQEGVARNYLKIAGKWQDHLLFSRTAE